jgi:hypothetical protein
MTVAPGVPDGYAARQDLELVLIRHDSEYLRLLVAP